MRPHGAGTSGWHETSVKGSLPAPDTRYSSCCVVWVGLLFCLQYTPASSVVDVCYYLYRSNSFGKKSTTHTRLCHKRMCDEANKPIWPTYLGKRSAKHKRCYQRKGVPFVWRNLIELRNILTETFSTSRIVARLSNQYSAVRLAPNESLLRFVCLLLDLKLVIMT